MPYQQRPFDVLYPRDDSRRLFTVLKTQEFAAWLDIPRDKRAQLRIAALAQEALRNCAAS
jgi:hypothetical protein